MRYSHLGLQFALSIVIFTGLGLWADRKLGTLVVFTLSGLGLGFACGTYILWKDLFYKKPPRSISAEKTSELPDSEPPDDDTGDYGPKNSQEDSE